MKGRWLILSVLLVLVLVAFAGGPPDNTAEPSIVLSSRQDQLSTTGTFGYTTQEETDHVQMSANQLVGSYFNCTSTGYITGGHMYGQHYSNPGHVKFVVLFHSNLSIVTNGVSAELDVGTALHWYNFTWVTAPTIVSGAQYILAAITDANYFRLKYDTGVANQYHADTTNNYATPQDMGTAGHGTQCFCIYVDWSDVYTPVNDVAPSCSNIDDTDNLYARYRTYTFVTSSQDQTGYADIHYVQLGASTDLGAVFWVVQYHEDDNTFSEVTGTSYIELITASSSATRSGINVDVTFAIKFEWACTIGADLALKQTTVDAGGLSDVDIYDVDYDYVYSLDLSAGPTLNDGSGTADRGPYNTVGGITASGTVCYTGFTSRHPPVAEVDVVVMCTDCTPNHWDDTSYEATGGTFAFAVSSDDVIGQDTYLFGVVKEGESSGGTNLLHAVHSDTYIADQDRVYWIVANATYNEYNHNVLLTVGLRYAYDGTAITTGSFTLRYGTTYLALTHQTAENWTVTDLSATAASRTYNYVNGSDTQHGISSINMDSKTATCHWDRIDLTVTITRQWTVIGYNVSVRVTGVYAGFGWTWNGTATFNSTWTAPLYPSESIAANWTYVVTSITNNDLSLVGFSANVVWCIWDDVIVASGPSYYWTQYNIDAVWLIWGVPTTYQWDVNGTWLTQGAIVESHMNGTASAKGAIWSATGDLSGLAIGPFNANWYYVNITVDVQVTVNGVAYDWNIWFVVIEVKIMHTIQLASASVDVQDAWITFYYTTEQGNATLTIWDNNTLVGYSEWEGAYQIAKPTTVGLHNYTMLYNMTHAGAGYADQVKNFVLSDLWIFQNWKYTVNPVHLSFEDVQFSQNNESVVITGRVYTSATTLNWTVYEASLGWTTGTISGVTSASWISWYWDKSSSTSTSNYTVAMTDGTYNVTFRGFYIRITGNQWIIYGGSTNVEGDTYVQNYYANATDTGDTQFQFVIAVVGLTGMAIFLGATLMWWDNRNKKDRDFRLAVAAGAGNQGANR